MPYMENFIVSARKYRPITFKSVVGQETITSTLKNSIKNNHLAQAFLFCGPRGVGKTTCARILAKTINCFNLTSETEPCNACESCTSFNDNASFNIHELDAASNNSVDDIRALIDQVRFAPQVGQYSIYIIDEVHMLSTAAFNAFLKTLEEPPKHAIFILATTERHKILPTILSRCQVFTFNRIKVDDIASHLNYVAVQEKIEADPDGLHVIAQKADGGLRDALSMFDQIVSFSGGTSVSYESVIENLNVLDYDYYFKITEFLQTGNFGEVLVLYDTVLNNGFEGWSFLVGLGEHFRNLLVCQDAVTVNLLEVSAGIRSRYHTQSKQWNPVTLIRCLDVISKTDQGLKSSKNQRLTIELGLLNLSSMFQHVEKKSTEATAAVNQPIPNPPLSPRAVPSSPEERKQVISFRGSVPIRTVSISEHLSVAAQKGFQDKPVTKEHSVVEDLPAKLFTEEALLEAWNMYAHKIQAEGRKSMFASLTLTKPALRAPNTVVFQVQNESQLKELEHESTDLVGYLRKVMDNFSITVEFVKAETPFKDKPFTASEKLKVLEERNPHVSTLLLKLGLKPE